ncbi:MAG: insulinase family protein [Actinobacteria bacterium]|nr:insulinase family protein [Actinomycetota bacterium]
MIAATAVVGGTGVPVAAAGGLAAADRAVTPPSRVSTRGVERSTLDSRLRVVTETMPDVRSVAVAFWVDVGSRDEPAALSGATHFLEHLLFKGTPSRTAVEIAEAVESVGGEMNAFTSREYTAYYIRIVDECLGLALDVLSDILWSPALRPAEVDSERQVILEEIRMRDDTPDDLVHDVFSEALLPGPLGREVVGTPEIITGMARDDIAEYHAEHYVAGNVVVAVAGNATHQQIVDGVSARFAGRDGVAARTREPVSQPAERMRVIPRQTEQAHVVLGMRALPRDDDDRYALSVLNQALGGGMSSRLFQEIREKRGLAYSVYCYRQGYEETGMLAAYAGTAPTQAREVVKLLHTEFDRLVEDGGITDEELANAKGAIKGSQALSLESPAARMNRIGRLELTLGEVASVDEIISRVDAVTPDDLGRVIGRVLADQPRTLVAIGPFDEGETLSPG